MNSNMKVRLEIDCGRFTLLTGHHKPIIHYIHYPVTDAAVTLRVFHEGTLKILLYRVSLVPQDMGDYI